jgi:hypothetical protein
VDLTNSQADVTTASVYKSIGQTRTVDNTQSERKKRNIRKQPKKKITQELKTSCGAIQLAHVYREREAWPL